MSTQLLHNARRAFRRAPVTANWQEALNHSGALLARYAQGVPDTTAGLRVREELTRCAEQYLNRCQRAARRTYE